MNTTPISLLCFVFLLCSCGTSLRVKSDFSWNKEEYYDLFQCISTLRELEPSNCSFESDSTLKCHSLLSDLELSNIDFIRYDKVCDSSIVVYYDTSWRLGYYPCGLSAEELVMKIEGKLVNYYPLDDNFLLWNEMIQIE